MNNIKFYCASFYDVIPFYIIQYLLNLFLLYLVFSAPCGFAGQKMKHFRGHRCLFGNT